MTRPTLENLGEPLRALRTQFESLVERHRPALWRYCLRLTGSPWDAEDLAQEALTRAFAHLTAYWQPLEPRAYLFRTATNAWVDRVRRLRETLEEVEGAAEVADARLPQPEAALAGCEVLVHLLPPRQRVVFLLAEVFDFRAHEVAGMLGTTEGAVKAALHRARETLARAVDGEEAPSRAARRGAGQPQHVGRFLEAFNRRDPEALLALLAEDVTVDIVGAGVDEGREVARRSAVGTWASGTDRQEAVVARVAGEELLVVHALAEDGTRSLLSLMQLEWGGEQVVRWRNYYFCPDLLACAAAELGLPFSRQRPFTTPSGYGFQATG